MKTHGVGWMNGWTTPDGEPMAPENWSPWVGCTPVSAGCDNCWAKRQEESTAPTGLARLGRLGGSAFWNGPVYQGDEVFFRPLHWKKPRVIFVCPNSDLFHEAIPDMHVRRTIAIMQECPEHVFIILTKRPGRVAKFAFGANVILLTSIEDQPSADKRRPDLLRCKAETLGLSMEPMIGPVVIGRWIGPQYTDIGTYRDDRLSWVIVGCESGPNRRPCKIEWVRSVVRQCRDAGVACYVKQINLNGRVSHDMAEWPKDLRVQERPRKEIK